ncbi:hypothetical protein GJ496_009346 [Pomphorhynchus laevis]|nr:hypothetical protein GJ496_009346 [Pomphorhynchus laevis]
MVSDNDSEILRSINTIGHDDIIPIIKVQINGQCINMEFDTGASASIISRAVWQHIGEPTLHPAKVLKTYGGQVLQSFGKYCIQACPNKLEAIQKIPTPTNKGELRSFLGAVNYLNRFIPSLQRNSKSLYELSGRRAVYSWKPEHTQAFEKVKESLMDSRNTNFQTNGILLWLQRIVIPRSIRYKALETLHLGHPGISAMRHLARLYCWWPTINTDIEQWVDRCSFCQKQQPKSAHQPLHQWDVPAEVWTWIHVDFAGPIDGQITGKAPAELLNGRRLKTIWDRLRPTTQTTVQSHREKQKERQDVNARPRQFDQPGSIIDRTGWGSYVVNTQNGERRRHADDLRTNKEVNTNRGVIEITGNEKLNDHKPSETIRRGTSCRKKPVRYDELAEELERRVMAAVAAQSMGNSSGNLTANGEQPPSLNTIEWRPNN